MEARAQDWLRITGFIPVPWLTQRLPSSTFGQTTLSLCVWSTGSFELIKVSGVIQSSCAVCPGEPVLVDEMDTGAPGSDSITEALSGHLIWGVTGKKHRWGSGPWIIQRWPSLIAPLRSKQFHITSIIRSYFIMDSQIYWYYTDNIPWIFYNVLHYINKFDYIYSVALSLYDSKVTVYITSHIKDVFTFSSKQIKL